DLGRKTRRDHSKCRSLFDACSRAATPLHSYGAVWARCRSLPHDGNDSFRKRGTDRLGAFPSLLLSSFSAERAITHCSAILRNQADTCAAHHKWAVGCPAGST